MAGRVPQAGQLSLSWVLILWRFAISHPNLSTRIRAFETFVQLPWGKENMDLIPAEMVTSLIIRRFGESLMAHNVARMSTNLDGEGTPEWKFSTLFSFVLSFFSSSLLLFFLWGFEKKMLESYTLTSFDTKGGEKSPCFTRVLDGSQNETESAYSTVADAMLAIEDQLQSCYRLVYDFVSLYCNSAATSTLRRTRTQRVVKDLVQVLKRRDDIGGLRYKHKELATHICPRQEEDSVLYLFFLFVSAFHPTPNYRISVGLIYSIAASLDAAAAGGGGADDGDEDGPSKGACFKLCSDSPEDAIGMMEALGTAARVVHSYEASALRRTVLGHIVGFAAKTMSMSETFWQEIWSGASLFSVCMSHSFHRKKPNSL